MKARGFTLLEVMVAVAILGLSLTVILSAQAGLYSSATYGQHLSIATGLARCRMSELEEKLLRNGYPELDDKDDGPCCEDDTRQDMRCTWKIEKVELPQPPTTDPSIAGGLADAGVLPGLSSVASGAASAAPLNLSLDGGLSNFASTLQGEGAGAGAAASGGLASMVMGFVYPRLKPMLEASIRKLTVTVKWHEGLKDRDFTIVQYVTHPARGGLLPGAAGSASPAGSGFPLDGVVPRRSGSGRRHGGQGESSSE